MVDNFGEWVESMGVASGSGYQEVGVASGWNLWVWLPCIGVVSVFSVLFLIFFYKYIANVTQRKFEIVKKNRDHANIIIQLYP